MPCIPYAEQNLFLAYVMSDKTYFFQQTYSWHMLCWTKPILGIYYVGKKPIPGICYVQQNLFLAYVMLDKTTYGT